MVDTVPPQMACLVANLPKARVFRHNSQHLFRHGKVVETLLSMARLDGVLLPVVYTVELGELV